MKDPSKPPVLPWYGSNLGLKQLVLLGLKEKPKPTTPTSLGTTWTLPETARAHILSATGEYKGETVTMIIYGTQYQRS